jgi:hypothetical protein
MRLKNAILNLADGGALFRDAAATKNIKVLTALLGPAFRGLIVQHPRAHAQTQVPTSYPAVFDWGYERTKPALAKLYEVAKSGQWNGSDALDWSIDVDPFRTDRILIPDDMLPVHQIREFRNLPLREKQVQRHAILSWILSQFLHGEQGALFAAAQVTEAVPWMDAKLYGSTQVVDEGRHVEVFHRYLNEKLEKQYTIDVNLHTILDVLMRDSRWDMKFLCMQIMVEGLALGGFATLRNAVEEPLLAELLKYVIGDEARHVQYGVIALREIYLGEERITEVERREREDWAFELSLLMRNRFLAHEFYEEFWAHKMSRRAWDKIVFDSGLMRLFRRTMFKGIIPNLKRIGLLTDRVRHHYEQVGLLGYETGMAAPDMSIGDFLQGERMPSPA